VIDTVLSIDPIEKHYTGLIEKNRVALLIAIKMCR